MELGMLLKERSKRVGSIWYGSSVSKPPCQAFGSSRIYSLSSLHQPSYTTNYLEDEEVADWTNGCVIMVMGNAYKANEALLFDHLHGRSPESNGFREYPPPVLSCHEEFTQLVRESSATKVEIIHGFAVQ